MKFVFVLVVLFSHLLVAQSQTCASVPLSTYSLFNKIVFGDYAPTTGCSIAGRLAVEGRVQIGNYQIANSLSPRINCSAPRTSSSVFGIIAGDRVAGTSGSVSGNVAYVGTYSNSNGQFTLSTGCAAVNQSMLDFDAMYKFYDDLSTSLGALSATGSAKVEYGGLIFNGTNNPVREVFNLPASMCLICCSNIADLGPTFPQFRTFAQIHPNATIIFNIRGASVILQSFDLSAIANWATRTVFNMPDATSFQQNSIHLRGLVLAPDAAFTSTGGGQVTGQLVTSTYTASSCISMNLGSFSGCVPDVANFCTGKAVGTACDDRDPCTVNDACNANAACVGTQMSCNAPGTCQVAGTCSSGVCIYPNATNGASCSDGNACTQTDTCQNGVCVGSNPVTCASRGTCSNPGVCQAATGLCTYTNKTNGDTCDDSNLCTSNDVCQNGVCVGTQKTCTAAGQCFVAGTCNVTTGQCSNPFAANGVSCNDGNACTQTDTCQSGVCVGGNPKSCGTEGECTLAPFCNTTTGACIVPQKTNGTQCTSVSNCFTSKTCQGGVCTGSSPVQCPPPGKCQLAGVCTDGTCFYNNMTNGASCDDGNPCTDNDVCTNGVCAGTAKTCAAPAACKKAGVCNVATGTCDYANQDNGFTCSDGNPCTLGDTCQSGVCTSGTAKTCTANNQCQLTGSCNTTTGDCVYPSKANGVSCSDGNLCNINSCQNGACVLSSTVTCAAPSMCKAAGVCQPSTGACTYANLNGTTCNDGNACTQTDLCISGTCTGFNNKVCTTSLTCKAPGTCNPSTGECSVVNAAAGTDCDDGNLCSYTSVCDTGVCVGNSWSTCPPPPTDCYNAGVCNGTNGECSYSPKPNGTPCDDGNACSASSTCQSGICTGSNWKVCTASNQCADTGSCNPSTGVCSTPNLPNGAICNDGNSCTQQDTCVQGTCVGNNTIVGCTNGGFPYELLTNLTSPITQTQTLWIPIYFRGLRELTMFQVRVTNYPTGGDKGYTFGFVEYPSGRNYTMPFKKDGLGTGEQDFVAIKLNPPQNQGVGQIVLNLEVKYQLSGAIGIGYEKVVVPVAASVGDFTVMSTVSPVGSLYAGQSAWFPINFKALSRLVDFQVTFSASNGLAFSYPSNTGNYTSFYRDSFINVGETDFVAVRVTMPADAVGNTNMGATMRVQWVGANPSVVTVPISFTVKPPGTKKDAQPFNLMDSALTVAPDSPLWVLLNVEASQELSKVQVKLSSENVDIDNTITRISSIEAGDIVFAPALVSASQDSSMNVFIKASTGDQDYESTSSVSLKMQQSYLEFQTGASLVVPPGASATYSLGFNLPDAVIGSIGVTPLTVVNGLNIQLNQDTNVDGMSSWFILVDVSAASDIAANEYPMTLEISYNTALTGSQSEKVSVFVAVQAPPNPEEPAPASKNSSGVNVGAAVGGSIGGVALVAVIAAAAVMIKKRRNKVSFVNMQDEQTVEPEH